MNSLNLLIFKTHIINQREKTLCFFFALKKFFIFFYLKKNENLNVVFTLINLENIYKLIYSHKVNPIIILKMHFFV